jgi:hypothetical protein
LLIACLGLGAASSADADSSITSDSSGGSLEKIVVTAQKRVSTLTIAGV